MLHKKGADGGKKIRKNRNAAKGLGSTHRRLPQLHACMCVWWVWNVCQAGFKKCQNHYGSLHENAEGRLGIFSYPKNRFLNIYFTFVNFEYFWYTHTNWIFQVVLAKILLHSFHFFSFLSGLSTNLSFPRYLSFYLVFAIKKFLVHSGLKLHLIVKWPPIWWCENDLLT